jgi:hypothetical protein
MSAPVTAMGLQFDPGLSGNWGGLSKNICDSLMVPCSTHLPGASNQLS